MKKVCIVTGGANGIGRCITETLIKAGYQAAMIDTDSVSLTMMQEKYPELYTFLGDITEKAVLDQFVGEIVQKFGHVDVLVNNACLSKGGLDNCSYEDFNYVLRLGVSAPFYLTQLLVPYLNEGASIINISSTRAFMSQRNTESYSAAKGAITALTHAMSITLAGKARVNAIAPGWIDCQGLQHDPDYVADFGAADYRQHTVKRIGRPEDIAKMTLFLCSEDAGFINGQCITVDGGMTKLMIYHGDDGWEYHGD